MPLTRPTLAVFDEREVRTGGSDKGAYGLNETTRTRRCWVDWTTDRANVAAYFLGTQVIDRDGSGNPTGLSRLIPLPHPDDTRLFCTRVGVVGNHQVTGKLAGLTDGSIRATYGKLELELTYERLKYRVLDDESVTAEHQRYTEVGDARSVSDVLQCQSGTLKYTVDGGGAPHGSALPFGLSVPQPTFEIPVTWRRLPYDLIDPDLTSPNPWYDRVTGTRSTRSYLGTISKTKFKRWPAGTLLLADWRYVQRPSPVDQPTFWNLDVEVDVEMVFQFRPIGSPSASGHAWNAAWYHDTTGGGKSGYYFMSRSGAFAAVGAVTDYDALYCERELADLFKVQA